MPYPGSLGHVASLTTICRVATEVTGHCTTPTTYVNNVNIYLLHGWF